MRAIRALTVLAVAAGTLAAVVATTPAQAAVTPWHAASYLSRLGVTLDRVSCSTAVHCTAIEAGLLLTTADGGATWADQTALVPADAAELLDVSCPTDTRCYVTGLVGNGAPVVYRIDSGALTTLAATGATASLPTIDCAAAGSCVATDGADVYVTTDAGTTWTTRPLGRRLAGTADYDEYRAGRVVAVSCAPTTQTCAVIGNVVSPGAIAVESTADAGLHWATTTLVTAGSDPVAGPVSVDCPTATTCFAATERDPYGFVWRTTDAGTSWQEHGAALDYVSTLSCGTATTCANVGGGHPAFDGTSLSTYRTTDGGLTWGAQSSLLSHPTLNAPAVSCTTSSACVLVSDGAASRSTDGGATWTTVELPAAVRAVEELSCPTLTTCTGLEPVDGTRSAALTGPPAGPWTAAALPAGTGTLLDLDCSSAKVCDAVAGLRDDYPDYDSGWQTLRSTNGGPAWTLTNRTGVASTDLTCPTTSRCLAIRSPAPGKIRRSTGTGTTWANVPAPQLDTAGTYGVACSSAGACLVAGTTKQSRRAPEVPAVWTTSDFGDTWTAHAVPFAGSHADCDGGLCVLAGIGTIGAATNRILSSTDGGATWTSSSGPPGITWPSSVSCGGSTVCAMATTVANHRPAVIGTTDAGLTWHTRTLPVLDQFPLTSNISCVRSTCFLAALDPFGRPALYTGSA